MNKIEATELGSEIEKRREKKIPLIDEVLSKIREIEDREDEISTGFISLLDESIEELWHEPSSLAFNYFQILEEHHKHEGDLEKFRKNAKQIQKRVENLADLVSKRKPKLSTEEQLELVDKLYDLSDDGDKFWKEDEIEALRTILETEKFKIDIGDPEANPAFASQIEAQIADLQNQLSF